MSQFHAVEDAVLHLANEFAAVSVAIDTTGNGPRLRVTNRQNGVSILLDPLELASLTWLDHSRLGPFLDPSQTGWSSNGASSNQGAPDEPDR